LDRCIPKVSELRARFPEKDIEVDGGVGPKNIDVCADAGNFDSPGRFYIRTQCGRTGCNVIVAGTAIFGAPNPEEVIATLKSTVDKAQAKMSSK
jgi:ribulose-phosphate 3-epimerase